MANGEETEAYKSIISVLVFNFFYRKGKFLIFFRVATEFGFGIREILNAVSSGFRDVESNEMWYLNPNVNCKCIRTLT